MVGKVLLCSWLINVGKLMQYESFFRLVLVTANLMKVVVVGAKAAVAVRLSLTRPLTSSSLKVRAFVDEFVQAMMFIISTTLSHWVCSLGPTTLVVTR